MVLALSPTSVCPHHQAQVEDLRGQLRDAEARGREAARDRDELRSALEAAKEAGRALEGKLAAAADAAAALERRARAAEEATDSIRRQLAEGACACSGGRVHEAAALVRFDARVAAHNCSLDAHQLAHLMRAAGCYAASDQLSRANSRCDDLSRRLAEMERRATEAEARAAAAQQVCWWSKYSKMLKACSTLRAQQTGLPVHDNTAKATAYRTSFSIAVVRLQELASLRAQVAKLQAEAAAMDAAAKIREKMDEVGNCRLHCFRVTLRQTPRLPVPTAGQPPLVHHIPYPCSPGARPTAQPDTRRGGAATPPWLPAASTVRRTAAASPASSHHHQYVTGRRAARLAVPRLTQHGADATAAAARATDGEPGWHCLGSVTSRSGAPTPCSFKLSILRRRTGALATTGVRVVLLLGRCGLSGGLQSMPGANIMPGVTEAHRVPPPFACPWL